MSTPALIMWAVVFVVGFPAALWNPTAAALVIAKLVGTFYWLASGDNLPVAFYLFPDIFVITMVMTKRERSIADQIVLLIFPIMWCLYVADMHAYYKWWALYYLVLAQFFAAGWESFSIYRRSHHAASDKPENTGTLLVAYGSGGYG